MADYVDGVKIAELPEAESISDGNLFVTEDSDATKQVTADKLKSYTNEELQDKLSYLNEQIDNLYSLIGAERIAFAVYAQEDNSLTFYSDYVVPSVGAKYNGKTVTSVYTGFDEKEYTGTGSSTAPPWYNDRNSFTSVVFDESFKTIQPIATAYWFYDMPNLTEITGLEYLDTSEATNMKYMIRECSGLTSLDVSGFDTAKVTDMNYMFYKCSGLTSLDVSGWDTGNVTNANGLFRSCSGLTSLDVSEWDTGNMTDMGYMFMDCSGLTNLDVSGFDTAKVTNMTYMFYGCTGLTSLDVRGWNTAKVTNMSYMFYSCSGLTSLDVSRFDTAKVTNMSYMFRGCSSLETIYSDDDNFVTTKVTSGNYMFNLCSSLVGGNGSTISTTGTTYEYAHVDTASNPGLFTYKEAGD